MRCNALQSEWHPNTPSLIETHCGMHMLGKKKVRIHFLGRWGALPDQSLWMGSLMLRCVNVKHPCGKVRTRPHWNPFCWCVPPINIPLVSLKRWTDLPGCFAPQALHFIHILLTLNPDTTNHTYYLTPSCSPRRPSTFSTLHRVGRIGDHVTIVTGRHSGHMIRSQS